MKMNRLIVGGGLFALAFCVLVTPGAAFAEAASSGDAASNGDDALSEIIVTAQRREQTLNDVGISVVAVSGEALLSKGIRSTEDLAKIVPGLTVASTGYGTTVLTLRGIGFYESSMAAASPVATYQDEIPIPYTRMAVGAPLDLQRVEVLKGPQGTLYGSNTTGGTVNFVTNKPTAVLEAGLDASLGRFGDTDVQGFVSGPISDTLRYRLAVRTEQSGDWQKSVSRNDTLGAKDLFVGRILLDWDAAERLKFELNVNGFIDKSDTQAFAATVFKPANPLFSTPQALASVLTPPGDDRLADWDADKNFRKDNEYYQLGLKSTFSLSDGLDLIALTSYQRYNEYLPVDQDATDSEQSAAVSTGFVKSLAQELRLQGNAGQLNYVVGGNYSHDDIFDQTVIYIADQSVTRAFGPTLMWDQLGFATRQKVSTKAAFGNVEFAVIPQLALEEGVRYTRQDRSFVGCLKDTGTRGGGYVSWATTANGIYSGIPGVSGLPVGPGGCTTYDPQTNSIGDIRSHLDQGNVSWRSAVNFKPNDDSLLYASVSRGYKQGSFGNVGATSAVQYTPARQETVLAYETGAKLRLLDHRLQLNSALFYYDYSDKQLRGKYFDPVLHGVFEKLFNVPKSRVIGGEMELTAKPLEGLVVQGQVTYADSKILSHFLNLSPLGEAVDFHGESFELTPKWSATASVEYQQPVSSKLFGFAGIDANYQGRQHGGYGNDPEFVIDPYTLVDLRTGIGAVDDRWRAYLWVRNVADKYYWTNANYLVEFTFRQAGMPRTYGVAIAARF